MWTMWPDIFSFLNVRNKCSDNDRAVGQEVFICLDLCVFRFTPHPVRPVNRLITAEPNTVATHSFIPWAG